MTAEKGTSLFFIRTALEPSFNMNTIHNQQPVALVPEIGESQPTDRENKFSDSLSECLKQQHDGALDILLQDALQDRNPRMIGIVGRHLIHANVGQRQAILDWTRMLSHEQLDEFNAQWHPIAAQLQKKQSAREHKLHDLLKNALQPVNASYLPRVLALIGKIQSPRLVDVVAEQFARANEHQGQVMIDWVATLPSDLAMRFMNGLHPVQESLSKRAQLLTYVTDNNSSVFRYLDARSMARLGLVSRGIRQSTMERPRFEAVGLMKDFPAFHALPENECHARCLEFLERVPPSECLETKVEAITQMAKHIFFLPKEYRSGMRSHLLSFIDILLPPHLRAQPLTALMTSLQCEPVFIHRAFKTHPTYPDWRLPDPVHVGVRRKNEMEALDATQFQALWHSAMNLDPEWQKPVITALLHPAQGCHGWTNTVLKAVHESDNERWKSTVLLALSDCYPNISLHSDEQADVVLSLMKKTKGTGPDFLALELLPDFIAKNIGFSAKEFKHLLNFIAELTPSDAQKPALIALAETLEHTWTSDYDLYDNCAAMLDVCQKTKDPELAYTLLLAVNKGIRRLGEDGSKFLGRRGISPLVSKMVREAEEAARRYDGVPRLALHMALETRDIVGEVTLDDSRRLDSRTLTALAGNDSSAKAARSHLQQFPESNHPELLVALMKQQWMSLDRQGKATDLSQDIEYFIHAIGQLPPKQQTRPLRALMHLCAYCDAPGLSPHLQALGELCRQSPWKAELLASLADQCIGKVYRVDRKAILMPLAFFDAIRSDMPQMNEVDQCAAYFALHDMAICYPEQTATTLLATLQPVFEDLSRKTPKRWH